MKRRDFLISGCGFCALALAGAGGLLMESCSPSAHIFKAELVNGEIKVPAPEIAGKKYLVVRNGSLPYDLLLVKRETTYHALPLQCTHRQAPLSVTSTGLVCNEHGSRFDFDGKVTQDPANRPLRNYPAELSNDVIVIKLNA